MYLRGVVYQNGKKIAEIAAHEIHEYLRLPHCLVWVALCDATAAELEQMRVQFGLYPFAVEDAQEGEHRPKIVEYGDSLFALLHIVEPVGREFLLGEVAIFAGPNYLVSVRRSATKGFDDVRARCEREPELLSKGSGYVLYSLIDAVVDRYFPLLDQLENELDRVEQHIFAPKTAPRETITELYELKQRLMIMKHAVAPLLEGLSNLAGGRIPPLCAGLTDYYRDVFDHLQRLNLTCDSIRDTVGAAMNVHLSLVTLQENETMKRLAAYAALLAVPTMIAGIYGMNFKYMPELEWRYGYALSLFVMAALDVFLFFWLRKVKWL